MQEEIKKFLMTGSIGSAFLTFLDLLPHVVGAISSFLAMIWIGIQIYESRTARALFGRKIPMTRDDDKK